jgi:hypothetical protein
VDVTTELATLARSGHRDLEAPTSGRLPATLPGPKSDAMTW